MADTATLPEKPRSRRYLFRANAKAGKRGNPDAGAFNGTCLVYEGDQFYLTLHPVMAKVRNADGKPVRGPDGKIKLQLIERKMPTWADPIAEYPLETPPKPIRVLAGAPPAVVSPDTAPPTVANPIPPQLLRTT